MFFAVDIGESKPGHLKLNRILLMIRKFFSNIDVFVVSIIKRENLHIYVLLLSHIRLGDIETLNRNFSPCII